ncbi:MAG: sensor histidine kinase [Bacteroidetes bacterium]|nr:sensor histidine kinase [Bacteroidota bacterium]
MAPIILLPQKSMAPQEKFRDNPPSQDSIGMQFKRDDSLRIPPQGMQGHGPPPARFNNFLFGALHYVFIFIALVFFTLILTINNRLKQSEHEKLQAELRYLKAQINPHFLFNSLNTIYSFAIEKSDATPFAVVKLSEMMRYVINDAGKDFVSLNMEINYINNYIELQQMRFGDSINLLFSVNGDIPGKIIAPLILIPFIENAFKYGVNTETVSVINIKIDVIASRLQMVVVNEKVKLSKALEERTGLGIINTKNRLQLLYPGKHELIVKDSDKYYVSLQLDLG